MMDSRRRCAARMLRWVADGLEATRWRPRAVVAIIQLAAFYRFLPFGAATDIVGHGAATVVLYKERNARVWERRENCRSRRTRWEGILHVASSRLRWKTRVDREGERRTEETPCL